MTIRKVNGVTVDADTLDGDQLATIEATMDTKIAAGRVIYTASGDLTAGAQSAKIFSWQNTEVSGTIFVFLVMIDKTTGSTGTSDIDVGQAATEIASNNLIDGSALSGVAVINSIKGEGTAYELGVIKVADDEWITGFEAGTGASTGLVGKYYIFYYKI